jgi:hypothetical protein
VIAADAGHGVQVDEAIPEALTGDVVVFPLVVASCVPSGDHSKSVASRSGSKAIFPSTTRAIHTSLPAADRSGLTGDVSGTPKATLRPSGDQLAHGGEKEPPTSMVWDPEEKSPPLALRPLVGEVRS